MMWTDMWGPHVSEGKRETGYPFGNGFLGRGPDLELGQFVALALLSIFFLLFFFSFSVFLINS
jgi:hypothetical protein